MQCLYCQKRLGLFASKKRPFCSKLHEDWYQDEQSGTAIRRLLDPLTPAEYAAVKKPLVPDPIVRARPIQEEPVPASAPAPEPPPLGAYMAQPPSLAVLPPAPPAGPADEIGITRATLLLHKLDLPTLQASLAPLEEELQDFSELTPASPEEVALEDPVLASPEASVSEEVIPQPEAPAAATLDPDLVVLEALFPLDPRALACVVEFPAPAPLSSPFPVRLPLRPDASILGAGLPAVSAPITATLERLAVVPLDLPTVPKALLEPVPTLRNSPEYSGPTASMPYQYPENLVPVSGTLPMENTARLSAGWTGEVPEPANFQGTDSVRYPVHLPVVSANQLRISDSRGTTLELAGTPHCEVRLEPSLAWHDSPEYSRPTASITLKHPVKLVPISGTVSLESEARRPADRSRELAPGPANFEERSAVRYPVLLSISSPKSLYLQELKNGAQQLSGAPHSGLRLEPMLVGKDSHECLRPTASTPIRYPVFLSISSTNTLPVNALLSVTPQLAGIPHSEVPQESESDLTGIATAQIGSGVPAALRCRSLRQLHPAELRLLCPPLCRPTLPPPISLVSYTLPVNGGPVVSPAPGVEARLLEGAPLAWRPVPALEPPSSRITSITELETSVAVWRPLAPAYDGTPFLLSVPAVPAAASFRRPQAAEIRGEDTVVEHTPPNQMMPTPAGVLSALRDLVSLVRSPASSIHSVAAPARAIPLNALPAEATVPRTLIPNDPEAAKDARLLLAATQSQYWPPRRPAAQISCPESALDIAPAPYLPLQEAATDDERSRTLPQTGTRLVPWSPRPPFREPSWLKVFPERVRPASLIEAGAPTAHARHGRIAMCVGTLVWSPASEQTKSLGSELIQVPQARRIPVDTGLWQRLRPRATQPRP